MQIYNFSVFTHFGATQAKLEKLPLPKTQTDAELIVESEIGIMEETLAQALKDLTRNRRVVLYQDKNDPNTQYEVHTSPSRQKRKNFIRESNSGLVIPDFSILRYQLNTADNPFLLEVDALEREGSKTKRRITVEFQPNGRAQSLKYESSLLNKRLVFSEDRGPSFETERHYPPPSTNFLTGILAMSQRVLQRLAPLSEQRPMYVENKERLL